MILILILLITGCNSSPPAITEKDACKLIIESEKLLSLLARGGDDPKPVFLGRKTQVLDDRINTKEKIMSLLTEIYTETRAKEIYEQFQYHEVNGKMFKPSYDRVSNVDEDKTEIKKIEVNNDEAQVIYAQPLVYHSTEDKAYFATKKAFFKYEQNSWKISKIIPLGRPQSK